MPVNTVIQVRRGTAAIWNSTNPMLSVGEWALETDTGKVKIGNGTSTWTALPYVGADRALASHTHTASQISDASAIGRALLTAATAAEARGDIGAGTSDLTLGTTASTAKPGNWLPNFSEVQGTLSSAQLPPLAISEPFVVTSQAAMLALTAQRGDVAIRTDINKSFILSVDAPATLANWIELTSAGDVASVAGKTGVVTLVKGDVGLGNVDNTADSAKPVSTAQQTALNLKANLVSPTFTGTVTLPSTTNGLSKGNVGLGSVDNTSDATKPISGPQQTALNLKADVTHTHTNADIINIDGGTP